MQDLWPINFGWPKYVAQNQNWSGRRQLYPFSKKKTFYEHCMRVHALLKNVHTFVVVLEEMQQTAQIISSLGVN